MNAEKRIKCLTWVKKVYPKKVIFSLMNYEGDLYFVNDSTETLAKVSTEAYGFIKDAIINNNPSYTYANVQPKESVKIEHYDEILDCDYILGLDIYIEFQNGSKIKIRPRNLHKGGVRAQALVYDDSTTPRYVSLLKLETD